MPELVYNFNSLYICLLLLTYNVWNSEYINIISTQLYLFNYTSILILINIVGLYLFLKNFTFEIKIGYSTH